MARSRLVRRALANLVARQHRLAHRANVDRAQASFARRTADGLRLADRHFAHRLANIHRADAMLARRATHRLRLADRDFAHRLADVDRRRQRAALARRTAGRAALRRDERLVGDRRGNGRRPKQHRTNDRESAAWQRHPGALSLVIASRTAQKTLRPPGRRVSFVLSTSGELDSSLNASIPLPAKLAPARIAEAGL